MSELHEACSTGDLEGLEEALKRDLDPNEADPELGGRTPLHIACSRGHKKCVYVLLQAGGDPGARTESGWTPAHCACETGQLHCLQTLLSSPATNCSDFITLPDHYGDTPSRIAEIYDHRECVNAISDHLKGIQSHGGEKESVTDGSQDEATRKDTRKSPRKKLKASSVH